MEELRARALDAVAVCYTEECVEEGTRPGNNPKNVFDLEIGCRLIVSREFLAERMRAYIHVSWSWWKTSELSVKEEMARVREKYPQAKTKVIGMFLRIGGLTKELFGLEDDPVEYLRYLSLGGIPHVYYEDFTVKKGGA
jgi:hypothetical protein